MKWFELVLGLLGSPVLQQLLAEFARLLRSRAGGDLAKLPPKEQEEVVSEAARTAVYNVLHTNGGEAAPAQAAPQKGATK